MPILQFLPSIRESETVTCRRCKTRQYPKDGNCVRCHCSLGVEYLFFQVGTLLDPHPETYSKLAGSAFCSGAYASGAVFANPSWHRCHLESTEVTYPRQSAGLRFYP